MQVLATEMFKIQRGLTLEIPWETFASKTSPYNLHKKDTFEKLCSLCHGTELLSVLVSKIWDLVQVELKQFESTDSFKLRIKNWIPVECPCRLCKTYKIYIYQVEFP